MTWDRWELGQKAIYYDAEIRSSASPGIPYPPHVETLRRSVLDFSHSILGYRDGPDGLQPDLTPAGPAQPDADPALTAARRAFNIAKGIHQGGYSENRWENFFRTQFFEPLVDSMTVSKTDSRRISRCNYYYDAFRTDSNDQWDLFRAHADDKSGLYDFERAKCPKPDYAFYLPMYHLGDDPSIPIISDPEARQWNKSPEHALVEPFSWTVLKKLSSDGLRPTPFRVFDKPPREASLKCFPWLLVEHKKEGFGEPQACCQAANGGACAVKLNQTSARYAIELPDYSHIPPMPTVTTVGSRVKVWIVYYAKGFEAPCERRYVGELSWKKRRKGYVMRAVWEGDMTKLGDVVKFQVILENTHTWAMRVHKPLISSYIEQWRQVHSQDIVPPENSALNRRQQTIERCQVVIPMVQGLLEHYTTLELEDEEKTIVTPLFLGSLVQQICSSERQALAEDVDRLITKRLGHLNVSSERTTTERTTVETQRISRRTSFESNKSTLPGPSPTDSGEDSEDDDYEDHIEPSETDGLSAGSRDAGNEFRRSTRSNRQKASPTHSRTETTYEQPWIGEVPTVADTHLSESVSPPRSSKEDASKLRSPGARGSNTPDRAGSHSEDASSPRSLQIPGIDSPGLRTSSELFSSPSNDGRWLGGKRIAPRTSSPQPPKIDWTKAGPSDVGDINLNFQPRRVSPQPIRPSSSGPNNVGKSNAQGGGHEKKEPLIDLTNDSQDP